MALNSPSSHWSENERSAFWSYHNKGWSPTKCSRAFGIRKQVIDQVLRGKPAERGTRCPTCKSRVGWGSPEGHCMACIIKQGFRMRRMKQCTLTQLGS